MCSSSFLIFVSKSMMRRTFFSNSGDFRFALVFRTESDTGSPHAQAIFEKTFWQRQWREPSLTVYEFHHHCATAGWSGNPVSDEHKAGIQRFGSKARPRSPGWNGTRQCCGRSGTPWKPLRIGQDAIQCRACPLEESREEMLMSCPKKPNSGPT